MAIRIQEIGTLNCKNCGAPLRFRIPSPSTITCEYCGTHYQCDGKYQDRTAYRETSTPYIYAINCERCVSEEVINMCGKEEMVRHAKEEIIKAIAKELAPYISFEEEDDYMLMAKRLRGRIRVVDPAFRFKDSEV